MGRTIKRLWGPAQVATGPTTVYTVPALTTAYLDHIWYSNPSGSAVTITVSIGADAAGTRVVAAFSVPAAAAGVSTSQGAWYLGVTLTTGEIVTMSAGTNNVVVAFGNGHENIAG